MQNCGCHLSFIYREKNSFFFWGGGENSFVLCTVGTEVISCPSPVRTSCKNMFMQLMLSFVVGGHTYLQSLHPNPDLHKQNQAMANQEADISFLFVLY